MSKIKTPRVNAVLKKINAHPYTESMRAHVIGTQVIALARQLERELISCQKKKP